MNTFINPKDPENNQLILTLESMIRALISPQNPVSISIHEIDCSDPGCMAKETTIHLKNEDQSASFIRIHKPIVYVRKSDLIEAFKTYTK